MKQNIYVRKRKRRQRVAILGSVSLIGVSILSLVAFLGRFVGQFTVSLNTGEVSLSLATKADFSDATSYLEIGTVPPFEETTYRNLPMDDKENFTSSVLDNESTDYLSGANYDQTGKEIVSVDYFKYTFYLKNVGEVAADYTFQLNFSDAKLSSSGRNVLDALRVMFFVTDVSEDSTSPSTTSGTVYALKSSTLKTIQDASTAETTTADQEYVSTSPSAGGDDGYFGLATNFVSDEVAFRFAESRFVKDEMRRFTLVAWLEGYDPDVDQIPSSSLEGASVKMGVTINAQQTDENL